MALTESEIHERIDALDRAIGTRERTVQFSDRAVTYRSIDEMMAARQHFEDLLARANGRPKHTLAVSNKGFR